MDEGGKESWREDGPRILNLTGRNMGHLRLSEMRHDY